MQELSRLLCGSDAAERVLAGVKSGRMPFAATGLAQVHKAHLCAFLRAQTGRRIVLLTGDEGEATRMAALLDVFMGGGVYLFPAREFVFYDVAGASQEWSHRRLSVLRRMMDGDFNAIVTSCAAAMQCTMPPERLRSAVYTINMDGEYEMAGLVARLLEAGYRRCSLVEGVGQFSVRGGILDFFPPHEAEPIRIEFFGDQPDLISSFDVGTQRRTARLDSASITPAMETLADSRGRAAITDFLRGARVRIQKKAGSVHENTLKYIAHDLERLESDGYLPVFDKYISLIQKPATIFSYLDCELLALAEGARLRDAASAAQWQHDEDMKSLFEKGILFEGLSDCAMTAGAMWSAAQKAGPLMLDMLPPSSYEIPPRDIVHMEARQVSGFMSNVKLLLDEVRTYLSQRYAVLLSAATPRRAESLVTLLHDNGVEAAMFSGEAVHGTVRVLSSALPTGFDYPDMKLCLLVDGEPARQRRSGRRQAKRPGERISSLSDLRPGDYVVHSGHGIGQYMGIQKLTVEGADKDYIKIKYAGEDYLYVPCHQLNLISKYISGGGETRVKLSKMGGAEWQRTKQRVRAAASDMAKKLIELYAQRQRMKGRAFSPDSEWQREFEESFPFEETDDQLRTTAEIKADMEKPMPMERLLCGDVGFGKTEVALRAAFKAVMDGTQVAILVPTTILAQQHYDTITARMGTLPVRVDMLSRFRTPKQLRETIAKISAGEVDIVVGTHRVIQKDVVFKNLGLVVIDEEQRFGVGHKEKLKELTKNVDVLTLTATPIPRTLSMALSGIRDMSVIEEPPGDRQSVQTYVMEYDLELLCEAIRRETGRGGQVFYLHNRVDSIDQTAAKLMERLPGVSIAAAHGQMGEDDLSDIWEQVVGGDIQVLVCTTIIETGVDVPNANTLIIEDADRLGLAQLYQIRGRVGRSARRAFAYLTYRKGRALPEDAARRLATIREFTEFGSGFKIALRDLEIRGAGNVLGAEQHGQMEAVGYDLYLKILEEAVLTEKGEITGERTECSIEVFVDTHLPESYIESGELRIDIYKKIAALRSPEEAGDLLDELTDRFGDIPRAVTNLIDIALIRNMASARGISEIVQKEGRVLFYTQKPDLYAITRLAETYKGSLLYNAGSKPYISLRPKKGEEVLPAIRGLLLSLEEYLNQKAPGETKGDPTSEK